MKHLSFIFTLLLLFSCKKKGVIIIKDKSSTKVNSTILFNPSISYNEISDHEGKVYKSVQIGNQIWMAENLSVSTFQNGDSIPTTTPYDKDIASEISALYQWVYNGDQIFLPNYGRLYTWNVVTDKRGVCPTGWRMPTEKDWDLLVQFVGGESVAGGKLKEKDTLHWFPPNSYASNSVGFTGLPGYYRNDKLKRHTIGHEAYFWTSTEYDATTSFCYGFSNESSYIDYTQFPKNRGLSVRCIKE
jgi:uncharacterized protein (TIGR02145 family)